MQEILKRITSGRWILTVVSAGTFAYAVYAKILEPAAISAILTAVFMSYFQKGTNGGTNIHTNGSK